MKRNIPGVSVLLLVSNLGCATASQTVYGFASAAQFHGKNRMGGFQIQANSYSHLDNAERYKHWLQSNTKFPVIIQHKMHTHRHLYAVLISDIPNVEALRETGRLLSHPTPMSMTSHPVMSQQPIRDAPGFEFSQWFVSIGGGQQFPTLQDDLLIPNGSNYPPPLFYDVYSTQNVNNAFVAVSAGRRWQRNASYFPAFSAGLLWQYAFDKNHGGTITQYAQPQFLNYTYRWHVQSNTVLANGKLTLMQYRWLAPYVDAGIGVAVNHAHHFSETALPGVTPRVSPGFQNRYNTQFSYILGAGIDLQVTQKALISIGYQYQDFGQVSSGYGVSTWSAEKLNLGSYRANAYLAQFTYLFDSPNHRASYEK